ncbi:beta-ketoacyl synthase N-terminal-like domain-containing protein [Paenibacillus chitinolyticus]|uniref:type I polyketide synthase n=1 Tax=Paenibacillus chitinolyticus TaxID=79263 RepID=UPI003555E063
MNQDKSLWEQGIAVIGMSVKFPGAGNPEAYWNLLSRGVHAVRMFSDEELREAGIPENVFNHPQYVKAKGVLEDPELFDAEFFGMSPRETELTDPQQRLFLECGYEALEDAAYVPDTYAGRIGVFGGCTISTYMLSQIAKQGPHSNLEELTALMLGNDKDFLTSRLSYKLNLRGPGMTVQTACSTSLVAVHMACQSLMSGESDIALAGGSSVTFPNHAGYRYQQGLIFSPDGVCRAFDHKAQGTVFGNGVGVVVLKRLEKAAEDGDFVYAVIRGSAVNNDGGLKAGFTAPSPEGQAEVIADAIAAAGVHPDTISYVEAHGTGTAVGDPIEVVGLTMAYRQWTDRSGFCAIGSVKTNIGHLDCAAGVAGLIKTVLALRHRQIPPSLHFHEQNPQIDFVNSPFFVNTKLTDWKVESYPRRAGVSSFGIGATNAHVVLEEAPNREEVAYVRPWHALLLSAKTETALEAACERMSAYLSENPLTPLEEIAYTTQVGRKAYPLRRAVVCQNAEEAGRLLSRRTEGGTVRHSDEFPAMAWIFMPWREDRLPGLLELCRTEPVFRRELQEALARAEAVSGLALNAITSVLCSDDTHYTQMPQLTSRMRVVLSVAASYSLAAVFGQLGLQPALVGGVKEGGYAAACIAGLYSIEDAFRLAIARAIFEEGGEEEAYTRTVGDIFHAAARIPYLNGDQDDFRSDPDQPSAERWLHNAHRAALQDSHMRLVSIGAPLGDESEGTLSCFDAYSWTDTLADLWEGGADLDWQARTSLEKRRRVPLPTYPFERRRYVIRGPEGHNVDWEAERKAAVHETQVEPADSGQFEDGNPRRTLERNLILFYQEVLGQPSIDIHVPLYQLGADSLSKMQVISRIQETYPILLNVERMYGAQTIAELADSIELSFIELLEQDNLIRG